MYNVFEFCVFSHSFLLIISIGLFLLVNICNITCDDIVSNIWSIYMYVLCILGSKRIVWFYIYMYIGGIVEIPALLLITWIYIKYNIHTLYSLSLQIHAHNYCVEHIFKILKLKKKTIWRHISYTLEYNWLSGIGHFHIVMYMYFLSKRTMKSSNLKKTPFIFKNCYLTAYCKIWKF